MTLALGYVRDYYELSKPRIIVLLLITTVAAMVMAARGVPPLNLLLWTLVGGALAAASAGAFNCAWDADIDRVMKRTAGAADPARTHLDSPRYDLRRTGGRRLVLRSSTRSSIRWRRGYRWPGIFTTSSSTRCGSSASRR